MFQSWKSKCYWSAHKELQSRWMILQNEDAQLTTFTKWWTPPQAFRGCSFHIKPWYFHILPIDLWTRVVASVPACFRHFCWHQIRPKLDYVGSMLRLISWSIINTYFSQWALKYGIKHLWKQYIQACRHNKTELHDEVHKLLHATQITETCIQLFIWYHRPSCIVGNLGNRIWKGRRISEIKKWYLECSCIDFDHLSVSAMHTAYNTHNATCDTECNLSDDMQLHLEPQKAFFHTCSRTPQKPVNTL